MLRHILFVALTLEVVLGHYDLFYKYGEKKIFESCFGESLIEKKVGELLDHVAYCKNESSTKMTTRKGFDWHAALSGSGSDDSPIYLPVPIITESRKPFFFNQRQKRHTYFPEDKLRKLKEKLIKKLKLASCVLQRLNFIDQNMEMQWNELEKVYTKDYGLGRELQEDLMEVFTKCKKFVSCMPFDQKKTNFPMGIKQIMVFLKCEKKKKIKACLKKDLRKKPEMFELQGLDGILDDYEDEDEKMLKVLKLFHKYGDDDLDFFNQ